MIKGLKRLMKFTNKRKHSIFFGFLAFCIALVAIIIIMLLRNYADSQTVLADSIEEHMITMAKAAREYIPPENLQNYASLEAIEASGVYFEELATLRRLAHEWNATYIYTVMKIDGVYRLVHDTDEEDTELFKEYADIPDVHLQAFEGNDSASAFDGDDEWGSYSTGSVPIWLNGEVIAVLGFDIEDAYLESYRDVYVRNLVGLIVIIVLIFVLMSVLLLLMLGNIKKMQDQLYRQAHYDKLTNLPNRQYLLDQLEKMTSLKMQDEPFALFFIDLDNFKKVNDTAGHDAGDELLKNIGNYLHTSQHKSQVFRPSAGALNVAARIGGDEFILVVPNVTSTEAEQFAEELISGLLAKVPDKNIQKYSVGFSIGIAMYPEHSKNFHVLLKYADIAMYHAKEGGKNAGLMYNDEMKAKDEK